MVVAVILKAMLNFFLIRCTLSHKKSLNMLNQVNYALKMQVLTTGRFIDHEKREKVIENVASQIYSLSLSSTTEQSAFTSTSRIKLTDLTNEPKVISGKIIGLSVGLPIGIFCFGLLIFLIYFYFIKNSILLSVQPVSPSESIKKPADTWFNKLFDLSYFHKRKDNYDIEKKHRVSPFQFSNARAIESQIQYKIGIDPSNFKRYESYHVQTPKNIHSKYPGQKLRSLDKISCTHVSKPHLSLASNVQFTIKKSNKEDNCDYDYEYPNISTCKEDKDKEGFVSKLVHNSHLDTGTYRNSVYQKINTLIPRLTPTIQLKNLKILSRVDKNYIKEPVGYENERSPMLDKSCVVHFDDVDVFDLPNLNAELCSLPSLTRSTISEELPIQGRYSSFNHSIERQVLDNNGIDTKSKIIIEPVPVEKINLKKSKIKTWSHEKELPVIPHHSILDKEKGKDDNKFNTTLKEGGVYPVIQPYTPQLADEINLSIGEYVRVLVVHEDNRWCLVEKCTIDGTSKSLINFGDQMKNNRKYLNDDRGIIPAECIMKIEFT